MTFFLYLGEAAFKLIFSIILKFLFDAVADNDKSKAYIFAFCGGFSWFLSQICRHNGFYQAPIIGARSRAGLIFLVFTKLSSMTQYVIKSNSIGKVTNMLSSDFNLI